MSDEKIGAYFSAVRSSSKYCTCDACNAVTSVIKLKVPLAIHQGGRLTGKSVELWFCDACIEKMNDALVAPAPEM